MTVLVTGGTGLIGGMVLDELVQSSVPVRALVRDPAASLPAGVEAVEGDLAAPESLDAALTGVDAVFLVWTLPLDAAPAVVDRLARQGTRVVFLSAPIHTPHPFFQQPNRMADLHAAIEQLIAAAGVGATVVRPGMFASNPLHWWAPAIRRGEPVRWPYAEAETAPVDERDVAAVAVRALCDDRHGGGDYVLTGPEALTQADQVRIIGDAIGRPVGLEELSPEQFRSETAATWPRPVVDMLLSAWAATMGVPAYVTTTVADVLGSPPRTFRQWAVDHAAAFRPV
jgi:uncharacterized protein YbjT (DUF2867 family)